MASAVFAGASDSYGDLGRSSLLSNADIAGQLRAGLADGLGLELLDASNAVVESLGAESLFGLDLLGQASLSLHLGASGALPLEWSGAGGEASFKGSSVAAAGGGREVVLLQASRSSVSESTGAVAICDVSSSFLAFTSLLDDVDLGVCDWDSHATFLSNKTTESSHATFALLEWGTVVDCSSPASALSGFFEARGTVLVSGVGSQVDGRALRALAASDFTDLYHR